MPEIKESDGALRLRGLLARDGLSVAGLTGAYEFFALSADGRVVGAKGASPSPAVAMATLLSTEDNGSANAALIATVTAAPFGGWWSSWTTRSNSPSSEASSQR